MPLYQMKRVPGDGFLWANLPAAAESAGVVARIMDFATAPAFFSDGTNWRPLGGRALIENLPAPFVSAASTALQPVSLITLPTGFWRGGLTLKIDGLTAEKSGTADTATIRLKIAGQTLIAPTLAGTAISHGGVFGVGRVSATSVQRTGNGPTSGAGPYTGTNTTARAAAQTVPNLDEQATAVELSVQMTAGSEVATISEYALWVVG